MKRKTASVILAAAFGFCVLGGCASTNEIKALQAQTQQALQEAQAAKQQCQSNAQAAEAAATRAEQAADRAEAMANKCENIFLKHMKK